MERLTTLTKLQEVVTIAVTQVIIIFLALKNSLEVIIDFPGHLGSGFHKFFQKCGEKLSQLGLTLTQVITMLIAVYMFITMMLSKNNVSDQSLHTMNQSP